MDIKFTHKCQGYRDRFRDLQRIENVIFPNIEGPSSNFEILSFYKSCDKLTITMHLILSYNSRVTKKNEFKGHISSLL